MTLEELRLLRLVQGILVRNYIDTQKLDIEVIGTSVYIKGEFRVFDYHPAQKKPDRVERDLGIQRTLMHIEQQIRSLAEVSYIEMKLSNWERMGMQWVARHEAAG
jgi:signal transduction histidine kinase